jgi:phosphatidate cytidylyltransferase
MLRWRLLLGTLFIAGLVVLVWLDGRARTPGTWLMPLALIVAWAATGELLWLFRKLPARPRAWTLYLGNLLIVGANALPLVWTSAGWLDGLAGPALALGISTGLVFWAEMLRYSGPGGVSERIGLGLLGLVYVGLLLSFVVQLRLFGTGSAGLAALASLVIVVKMCDIGAYTVGRLVGRHKMAPVLSPGKTIEGAVGGIAFACLGSWFTFRVLLPGAWGVSGELVGSGGWLLFGVLVGGAGMFGDLAESLLKRDLGSKDSSPWMPGFGGVLDLVDSVLLAAPVAFGCWASRSVWL